MAVAADLIVRDKLYIGGEWVEPSSEATIDVVNPATEEVIARIPEGTPEDVDRAVAAARAAFEVWSQTPIEVRADTCAGIAAKLAERGDELAALIATELGMPLTLSKMIQAGLPTMSFGSIAEISCSSHHRQASISLALGRLCRRRLPRCSNLKCLTALVT